MYIILVYSDILPTESRLDPFFSLKDKQVEVYGLRI